jgi:hypothetical protein
MKTVLASRQSCSSWARSIGCVLSSARIAIISEAGPQVKSRLWL